LKKRRQLKTLFVILILSLLSCREENDVPAVTTEAGDGLVRFSYTLSGAGVTTRFAYDDFEADDRVGIYMVPSAKPALVNAYAEADNVEYATDALNNLTPVSTAPLRLPSGGVAVKFVSYYPYQSAISDYKIPVTIPSNVSYPVTDMGLLYATAMPSEGGVVNFAYQSQMCKLMIHVTRETGCTVDLSQSPQLTITGIPTTANFNLSTGSYEDLAGTDAAVTVDEDNIHDEPTKAYWELLAIPHTADQAAVDGRIFTFTFGGQAYTFYLPVDLALVAGEAYTLNFEVKGSPATVDDGKSNCYMVTPGDRVTFKVARAYLTDGESSDDLRIGNTYTGEFGAAIVWADTDVIRSVHVKGTGKNAEVTVNTDGNNGSGNAVVRIYKKGNDTEHLAVWSYHIWVTDYDPDNQQNGTTYTNSFTYNSTSYNYTFMDRNLGATHPNVGADKGTGLFYQWGRKDPFPRLWSISTQQIIGRTTTEATTQATGNMTYATLHPWVFISNADQTYNYDWDHTEDMTRWQSSNKTIYDPCPKTWRVGYDYTIDNHPTLNIKVESFTNAGHATNMGNWGAVYFISSKYHEMRHSTTNSLLWATNHGNNSNTGYRNITLYRKQLEYHATGGASDGHLRRCIKD
jgi:hypothetical protein